MKTSYTLFILFLPYLIFSQNLSLDAGETYAVVVGISDYQDEQIPDLRFADKDALAFAGFLQSPAGGALDENHLKVLINEQATVAQFAIALDWLWEVVKENDKVIIYFSGHGDVERKSLTQPGFLLCWDAPAQVYLAGGTLALPMFQEVISTLSVQNKAKVIVITDACRSGKLSGSSVGGSQLTSNNLAKQYANEIKILSCQPDEYSIEGEQWGGGRGAFSYHLLDGLYGMADGNEDLSVNLLEIGRYLEDHVSTEVAPHSQIPMTVGSRGEKLTSVFPDILAQLIEGKRGQMQFFSATESRGIEEDVLASVDSITQKIYNAFKRALREKQFLSPVDACADDYYRILSREPKMEKLYSNMRRNYAAALQDDAQQTINKTLKEDLNETLKIRVSKLEAYANYPQYLKRAAELLGEDHYMYPILNSRRLYFEAYLIMLTTKDFNTELRLEALNKLKEALLLYPSQPHVYLNLGWLMGSNFSQPDSMDYYFNSAIELAPNWILPYLNGGIIYNKKYKNIKKAKSYLDKGFEIDSNSVLILNALASYYYSLKEYDLAEEYLKRALQIDSTDAYNLGRNNLGAIYLQKKEYSKAEHWFKKAIEVDSTRLEALYNLGNLYNGTRRYDLAEEQYKKAIQIDSTATEVYVNLGNVYSNTHRYNLAEQQYKKAIQIDSTFKNAHNNLATIYNNTRRHDLAEQHLKKAIQIDSTFTDAYNNLGNVYYYTQQNDLAKQNYTKVLQLDSTNLNATYNLGLLYQQAKHYELAIEYNKKVLQLNSNIIQAYNNLGTIYTDIQRYEEAESNLNKAIDLNPKYLDTRIILGRMYLKSGRYEEAKLSFNKSLELSPESTKSYLYLAQLALKENQIDIAWKYLEKLSAKDLTDWDYEYLHDEPEFEPIQKSKKWDELVQKLFPNQNKK